MHGLTLIKVDNLAQMRVWNELMICDHPQGAGPLVGAQMRYLIGSEHGWLGGFGAAALQLRDRDLWIGAWIKGLRECSELAAEPPDTRQVCVMDREADFFELFDEQRRSRGVDLLVRAKHDRATSEELNLFEAVT